MYAIEKYSEEIKKNHHDSYEKRQVFKRRREGTLTSGKETKHTNARLVFLFKVLFYDS
jgi:hypothetical protein